MPRTVVIPKPLLRIGDTSILGRLLSAVVAAGVKDIYILTKHNHEYFVHKKSNMERKLAVRITCIPSDADKLSHSKYPPAKPGALRF